MTEKSKLNQDIATAKAFRDAGVHETQMGNIAAVGGSHKTPSGSHESPSGSHKNFKWIHQDGQGIP